MLTVKLQKVAWSQSPPESDPPRFRDYGSPAARPVTECSVFRELGKSRKVGGQSRRPSSDSVHS
eukprot:768504-Hanusia_phi.AAC.6